MARAPFDLVSFARSRTCPTYFRACPAGPGICRDVVACRWHLAGFGDDATAAAPGGGLLRSITPRHRHAVKTLWHLHCFSASDCCRRGGGSTNGLYNSQSPSPEGFSPSCDRAHCRRNRSGLETSSGSRHVACCNLTIRSWWVGGQRSISPNTMSSEPMIAAISASICPRLKKSIACRWANDGARILHL